MVYKQSKEQRHRETPREEGGSSAATVRFVNNEKPVAMKRKLVATTCIDISLFYELTNCISGQQVDKINNFESWQSSCA